MVPVSLHTVPARDASVQMIQQSAHIDVSVIPIFVISALRRCSISPNGRYGVFKLKNILSSIAAMLGFNNAPNWHPSYLSLGAPNKFHQSRFSGVARVKRMARKLRNRRRSRA